MTAAHSLLTLLSALPGGAALRAQKGEVAEGSVDFTAMLDAMATPGNAPATADLPMAKEAADILPLAAKPAKSGNGTGKILPLSLPLVATPLPLEEKADQPLAPAVAAEDGEATVTAMPAMPEPASTLLTLMPAPLPLVVIPTAASSADTVVTRPQPVPMLQPSVREQPLATAVTASSPPQAAGQTPYPANPIQSAATPARTPAMPVAAGIAVTVRAAAEPVAAPPAAPVPVLAVPPAGSKPIVQPAQPLAVAAPVAEPAPIRPRNASRAPITERPAAPVSAAAPATPLVDIAANLAVPTVQAANPTRDSAPHDIAAVVDRLAAARDALAPAAATIAIDHAEFGELSLRFDQKADGGLSMQVAAATPEAHRAIAQAVSADGGQTLGGHGQGNGQQPQSQPAPQQQPAQTASFGQPAPSGSERDARGSQPGPRQDPQPRSQQARSASSRTTSSGEDDGIFA